MEYYKKYRPTTLDGVLGCSDTVNSLKSMLASGTLPHTILLHGPSGTGKTTIARILATELGCHEMDFKELNSASFRGIDSVREIQRTMNLAPVAGPVRVWLIDECHKWTNDAQNAALKILEDTPKHVYFFLCTTDPNKLIKAVLTRCTEMPVRALSDSDLCTLIDKVCRKEKIKLETAVRDDLVAGCGGSARTALVVLEKLAALPEAERAASIATKLAEENESIDLCRALLNKAKWPVVASILKNLKAEPETVRWSVIMYAKAVLLSKGDYQSYRVIDCFRNNFFDSKEAGLACACYEAVNGD